METKGWLHFSFALLSFSLKSQGDSLWGSPPLFFTGIKHSSWSIWIIIFCLFRDGNHNNVAFWKLFPFFLSLFPQSALSWTGLSEAQADLSSTVPLCHPPNPLASSLEPWISMGSSMVVTLHCVLLSVCESHSSYFLCLRGSQRVVRLWTVTTATRKSYKSSTDLWSCQLFK